MLNKDEIAGNIAYCGLLCRLCFLAEKCDGCKSANNQCDRNLSDEKCANRECCISQAIEGCWQCEEIYDCEKGIYSLGDKSKIKAFAISIREDGEDFFISRVLENMKKGWSVEKGKDYDGRTIKEVLSMIRG